MGLPTMRSPIVVIPRHSICVDLVPNILRGVADIDMSVEVWGQKLALPFYCSPTAVQQLFHYDGERAVAAAASAAGTMFGCSSLGTAQGLEFPQNPAVMQ